MTDPTWLLLISYGFKPKQRDYSNLRSAMLISTYWTDFTKAKKSHSSVRKWYLVLRGVDDASLSSIKKKLKYKLLVLCNTGTLLHLKYSLPFSISLLLFPFFLHVFLNLHSQFRTVLRSLSFPFVRENRTKHTSWDFTQRALGNRGDSTTTVQYLFIST